jgi:hypothetical protein
MRAAIPPICLCVLFAYTETALLLPLFSNNRSKGNIKMAVVVTVGTSYL